AHIVDVLLIAPRGEHSAELTSGGDEHGTAHHRRAADPRHEGARVGGGRANSDGRPFRWAASRATHIDVIAPALQRTTSKDTNGYVVVAGGVAEERLDPAGGVVVADGITERIDPAGSVLAAGGVVAERTAPGGGVAAAGGGGE